MANFDAIGAVTGAAGAGSRVGASAPKAGNDADFAETLASAFEQASEAEAIADDKASRFAAGDPSVGIHEAIIAAEKANVSVRFAVSLKNKLLDAYRELMNTQV